MAGAEDGSECFNLAHGACAFGRWRPNGQWGRKVYVARTRQCAERVHAGERDARSA